MENIHEFDPTEYPELDEYEPPQPTTYTDTNGRVRTCRVMELDMCADDPMTIAMGAPMGDFYHDARRRDLHDGCPVCIDDAVNNPPGDGGRW